MKFESEFEIRYSANIIKNNANATDKLDFLIQFGNLKFYVELKEKNQRYNSQSWDLNPQRESEVLILDDLTIRKMLSASLHTGTFAVLLYRDCVTNTIHGCFTQDFLFMEKKRVNRKLQETQKGKWIVMKSDFHQLSKHNPIEEMMHIWRGRYSNFATQLECWGNVTEQGGIPRTQAYRNEDFSNK